MKHELLLVSLILPCCGGIALADEPIMPWSRLDDRMNLPLSKVTPDLRPPLKIDPERYFKIEFGRGSGARGLDVIKIAQDGRVIAYRMKSELKRDRRTKEVVDVLSWERATLNIPPEAVSAVLKAVEGNDILSMHKKYFGGHGADGTQWAFWIKQGTNEKAIYFDNHFPDGILRFAEALDALLEGHGLREAAWERPQRLGHDAALWAALRR